MRLRLCDSQVHAFVFLFFISLSLFLPLCVCMRERDKEKEMHSLLFAKPIAIAIYKLCTHMQHVHFEEEKMQSDETFLIACDFAYK